MFKWLQNISCQADTESYRGSSLVIYHAPFLERFFVACYYSLNGDGKCLTCQWHLSWSSHTWWGDKKKSSSLKSLKLRKNFAATLEKNHNAQYRVLTLKRETVTLFREIFTNRNIALSPVVSSSVAALLFRTKQLSTLYLICINKKKSSFYSKAQCVTSCGV